MNILFVSHSPVDSNSFYHIRAFLDALRRRGVEARAAVPLMPPAERDFWHPRGVWDFPDFLRAWDREGGAFGPGLVHCWSPRGMVREFTASLLDRDPGLPLVVHFEDPEYILWGTGKGDAVNRSHPVLGPLFVELAQGVTAIVPELLKQLPEDLPGHTLLPGVEADFFVGEPEPGTLPEALEELPGDACVLGYFGNTHEMVLEDVLLLYRAVCELRAEGLPIRLVRTGVDSPEFRAGLGEAGVDLEGILELGWVERERMPALVRRVDAVVQPGAPGPFHDFRLPSKLPEALASGKPLIMGKTNLGRWVSEEAFPGVLFDSADLPGIKAAIRKFHEQSESRAAMGERAKALGRERFDLESNVTDLLDFYQGLPSRVERFWDGGAGSSGAVHDLKTALAVLNEPPSGADRWRRRAGLLGAVLKTDFEDGESGRRAPFDSLRDTVALVEQLSGSLGNLDAMVQGIDARIEGLETENHRVDLHLREATGGLQVSLDKLRRGIRDLLSDYNALRNAYHKELRWRRSVQAGRLYPVLKPLLGRPDESPPAPAPDDDKETHPLLRETARLSEAFSAAGDPGLPGVLRHPPGIRYHIDLPGKRVTCLSTPVCTVAGWFLDEANQPASAIEIRAGDIVVGCRLNQPREEALAGIADAPESASLCGFVGEISVHAGLFDLGIWVTPVKGVPFELARRTVVFFESMDIPEPLKERQAYTRWVETYGAFSKEERSRQITQSSRFPIRPLLSICLPVFNSHARYLQECLESVLAQTYPHWELCIADDASDQPHVREILEAYAARDSRIRVCYRRVNGHIAAATNSALELASGDWVGFLDHDDLLDPRALFRIVEAVNENPNAKIFYTDEDKVAEDGELFDPYFKPDWNPDLFLGQNMLSHFTVLEKGLLDAIGGLDPDLPGSQDWDLYLRASERAGADGIVHIPRVLYHWRALPESTAADRNQKAYAIRSAERALNAHLKRTGQAGRAECHDGQYYRIQWSMPEPAPSVSLVIPTRDQVELLRVCVEGILDSVTYTDLQLIVVDNQSQDVSTRNYLDSLGEHGVDVLTYKQPFNFSAIVNFAVKQARGDVVGLLNNDLEVIHDGWFEELVAHACRPNVGVVGCKLLYPNDSIQHAGVILGPGGCAGHAFKRLDASVGRQMNRANLAQNYSAVTGACMFFRKAVFEELGGFNEIDLKVAFNDVDFCLRAGAAGYRVVYTPFATLYHHESQSRGLEDDFEKQSRFGREMRFLRRNWQSVIANDPAYNPNLTLDREDFSLAWPPRLPEFAGRAFTTEDTEGTEGGGAEGGGRQSGKGVGW